MGKRWPARGRRSKQLGRSAWRVVLGWLRRRHSHSVPSCKRPIAPAASACVPNASPRGLSSSKHQPPETLRQTSRQMQHNYIHQSLHNPAARIYAIGLEPVRSQQGFPGGQDASLQRILHLPATRRALRGLRYVHPLHFHAPPLLFGRASKWRIECRACRANRLLVRPPST